MMMMRHRHQEMTKTKFLGNVWNVEWVPRSLSLVFVSNKLPLFSNSQEWAATKKESLTVPVIIQLHLHIVSYHFCCIRRATYCCFQHTMFISNVLASDNMQTVKSPASENKTSFELYMSGMCLGNRIGCREYSSDSFSSMCWRFWYWITFGCSCSVLLTSEKCMKSSLWFCSSNLRPGIGRFQVFTNYRNRTNSAQEQCYIWTEENPSVIKPLARLVAAAYSRVQSTACRMVDVGWYCVWPIYCCYNFDDFLSSKFSCAWPSAGNSVEFIALWKARLYVLICYQSKSWQKSWLFVT